MSDFSEMSSRLAAAWKDHALLAETMYGNLKDGRHTANGYEPKEFVKDGLRLYGSWLNLAETMWRMPFEWSTGGPPDINTHIYLDHDGTARFTLPGQCDIKELFLETRDDADESIRIPLAFDADSHVATLRNGKNFFHPSKTYHGYLWDARGEGESPVHLGPATISAKK